MCGWYVSASLDGRQAFDEHPWAGICMVWKELRRWQLVFLLAFEGQFSWYTERRKYSTGVSKHSYTSPSQNAFAMTHPPNPPPNA